MWICAACPEMKCTCEPDGFDPSGCLDSGVANWRPATEEDEKEQWEQEYDRGRIMMGMNPIYRKKLETGETK